MTPPWTSGRLVLLRLGLNQQESFVSGNRSPFPPLHPGEDRVLRSRFFICPLALLFVVALVDCGGKSGEAGNEDHQAVREGAPAPIATSPAAGSEEVGLHALVADVREGIEPLPATVGHDPDGASQVAVRLYVTRQEAIEAKWGPGSEGAGEGPLARSVAEAEHRFHELMELLNATPPPDSVAVAEAVSALDARLAEVLRKAEEQGVE